MSYNGNGNGNFIPLKELGFAPDITREPEARMTESEAIALSEALVDEMVDYYRSMIGWRPISGMWDYTESGLDEKQFTREMYVKRSRQLARREPISKQALRLYTTYSGILKVEFKSKKVQAEKTWSSKFWKLKTNRAVLKPINRRKLSINLLTDGELFLPLFPFNNGDVVIRKIDALQFVGDDAVLTHPEDKDIVLYYRRTMPTSDNKKKTEVKTTRNGGSSTFLKDNFRYYRAIDVDDEVIADAVKAGFEMPPKDQIAKTKEGNEVLMYHVTFDSIGLRGNGLLFAVVSYIENFRNFLQDRASIVRGLSTYIREITVNGGSKAVSDFASRFRSALGVDNFVDTNPPDAAGATWVQNQQVSKRETPPVTGAGDAMNDARIMRQPIAAGVGITEANLIGDPAIGNLASQEQMEGPQLQNFQDYQFLWEEAFRDLWDFVQEHNGANADDIPPLDVDMPPIIRPPLATLWTVLQGAQQAGFVPFEEAARQILMALGSNDIDSLIKTAKKEKEERKETALQMTQGKKPGEEEQGKEQKGQGQPPPEEEIQQEMEEVDGTCPFCGVEGSLMSAHDNCFCQKCGTTFHPSFYEIQKLREELFQELENEKL